MRLHRRCASLLRLSPDGSAARREDGTRHDGGLILRSSLFYNVSQTPPAVAPGLSTSYIGQEAEQALWLRGSYDMERVGCGLACFRVVPQDERLVC
jgi:hypothetical protein